MLGCVIVELEELGSTVVAVELPLSGFDADVAAARLAIEAARAGKIFEWPTDNSRFRVAVLAYCHPHQETQPSIVISDPVV